jgi:regulatory protein
MRAPAPADPYVLALGWLARRELTAFQIRQRLGARQVPSGSIDEVLGRLRRRGALDDRRTALAVARTAVVVKRHGRHRVLRQLEAIGIDRALAQRAVGEVFESLDEQALLDQALARRLGRTRRIGTDPAERRRLYAYLVRQGFDASAVSARLRARFRRSPDQHDD